MLVKISCSKSSSFLAPAAGPLVWPRYPGGGMGGMTRLNGMGMFMEPIRFGPAPIMPTWSWVWKYILDGRPVKTDKQWQITYILYILYFSTNKHFKSRFIIKQQGYDIIIIFFIYLYFLYLHKFLNKIFFLYYVLSLILVIVFFCFLIILIYFCFKLIHFS